MELETQILQAVAPMPLTSVRYLVTESMDDFQPQPLPFAVFTTGDKVFEAVTFCGADPDFMVQEFEFMVFAKTAEQCRLLAKDAITFLKDVGTLIGMEDSYESELRSFVSTLTFTT